MGTILIITCIVYFLWIVYRIVSGVKKLMKSHVKPSELEILYGKQTDERIKKLMEKGK